MPLFFYPFGFILAMFGLMLWFQYEKNDRLVRFAQVVFILGFGLYVLSLMFAQVSWGNKLFLAFRDMAILAVINWVLMLLKPKTIAFWAIVLLLIGVFQYFAVRSMITAISGEEIVYNVDEEGEWLVEMEPNADLKLLSYRLKGLAKFRNAFEPSDNNSTDLDDYLVVNVLKNDTESVKKVADVLKGSAQVESIEANEVIKVNPIQKMEATRSNEDLGINDPEVNKQWAMQALQMKSFYAFLRKQKIRPKKKVKLAILDTGVDSKHEDLKDNYVSIEKRSDNDPQGHGTHCAGIAGAVSNNGIGIASFGLGHQFYAITSVKVLNANGMGTQETIIDGMLKAADNGVSVISMSLGGRVGKRRQKAYEKAVKYANKKGAIVVVAAGNENRNATGTSPANIPGVITVSAVDSTLTRAIFSNEVGDLAMGISAPGVAIYSTMPDDQYASLNGTSMATPYVAGLIAMMKSINPTLTTKEIYRILSETGKMTRNDKETGRLIQPFKVLKQLFK